MKFKLAVHNQTRQTVLGTEVSVADTLSSRLIGLLGRRRLPGGSGLLIHPSCAVHSIGMLFSIDVLFLDAERKVVGICSPLAPFRISSIHLRSECVLELPAKAIRESGTQLGDTIDFEMLPA